MIFEHAAGLGDHQGARALGARPPTAALAVLFAALAGDLFVDSTLAVDPMLKPWLDQTSFCWPFALAALAFILLYKLGDQVITKMIKPFWVDRGLTLAEIGLADNALPTAGDDPAPRPRAPSPRAPPLSAPPRPPPSPRAPQPFAGAPAGRPQR